MRKNQASNGPCAEPSVRFRGITHAADQLGCTSDHLRMVLRGILKRSGFANYPDDTVRDSRRLEAKIRKDFPGLLKVGR